MGYLNDAQTRTEQDSGDGKAAEKAPRAWLLMGLRRGFVHMLRGRCDAGRFIAGLARKAAGRGAQGVNAVLARFGLKVVRLSNTLNWQRAKWLERLGISVVVDVGANIGQYATALRRAGYRGRIVSFEPEPSSFARLRHLSSRTQPHVVLNVGLDETAGMRVLHVTAETTCSSFLTPAPDFSAHYPGARVRAEIPIQTCTLDSVIARLLMPDDRVALKIDTQGFELPVLRGALQTLERVLLVEVELTLTALYEDQALLPEVWSFLTSRGYLPVWWERGYIDPVTCSLKQVDALFVNSRVTG